MGYDYGAGYGFVIPFDEKTAMKFGFHEEFQKLIDWEDGLYLMTESGDIEDHDEEPGSLVLFIQQKINEVIPPTFWEIFTVTSDLIQSGSVVDEGGYFIYIYRLALFEPKPLLQTLTKEYGMVEDWWVVGG